MEILNPGDGRELGSIHIELTREEMSDLQYILVRLLRADIEPTRSVEFARDGRLLRIELL